MTVVAALVGLLLLSDWSRRGLGGDAGSTEEAAGGVLFVPSSGSSRSFWRRSSRGCVAGGLPRARVPGGRLRRELTRNPLALASAPRRSTPRRSRRPRSSRGRPPVHRGSPRRAVNRQAGFARTSRDPSADREADRALREMAYLSARWRVPEKGCGIALRSAAGSDARKRVAMPKHRRRSSSLSGARRARREPRQPWCGWAPVAEFSAAVREATLRPKVPRTRHRIHSAACWAFSRRAATLESSDDGLRTHRSPRRRSRAPGEPGRPAGLAASASAISTSDRRCRPIRTNSRKKSLGLHDELGHPDQLEHRPEASSQKMSIRYRGMAQDPQPLAEVRGSWRRSPTQAFSEPRAPGGRRRSTFRRPRSASTDGFHHAAVSSADDASAAPGDLAAELEPFPVGRVPLGRKSSNPKTPMFTRVTAALEDQSQKAGVARLQVEPELQVPDRGPSPRGACRSRRRTESGGRAPASAP